jgi:hypothetical protein
MDPTTLTLIEHLHASSGRYVLALAGGGTTAAAHLLSVPGGSRTILEVVVPYHGQAVADFLGYAPDHYCSAPTARALARRAYERATWLAPRELVVGVGCTASLATDRPKRGDHRVHLAVDSGQRCLSYTLTFTKDIRDREGEESIVDAMLLNALAEALGVAERLPLALQPPEEVQVECVPAAGPLAALFRGEAAAVLVESDGRLVAHAPRPAALLPGSFNPLHEAHVELAAVASRILKAPVAFELSVTNADKPPLTPAEVDYRVRQFAGRESTWLTQAPTFVAKATLFPGVTFIVGADTAARIVAPRFYQDDKALMTEALERIRGFGCRFLVGGRADENGQFATCESLGMPAEFGDLFTAIPESAFRRDVSSTQLREHTRIGPQSISMPGSISG